MADDADQLPDGLYERLVTRALNEKLLRFDPARTRVERQVLDQAEAPATLARHVERVFARALRGLPEDERLARQAELANALLAILKDVDRDVGGEEVALPPEELRTIQNLAGTDALSGPRGLTVPLIGLSDSDLLVNARGEPGLASNLAREIPSADSIELLCAFVRWHGLRVIEDELRAHCRAGKPLRVITSVYTGSTERKALDWLVGLGAAVKVSYDTESTRLHAKAWLFRRASGYSTAYIGSSNLSKAALLDGVEWNVRLSQITSPDILEKFDGTFQSYWESADSVEYQPARDGDRLDNALARASGSSGQMVDGPLVFFDIQPWTHQSEMLERLAVERSHRHRHKNLIVAATGTGKTIVSAFDFKSLRQSMSDPTLLFVAHRQEILTQSVGAFRQVLRSGTFGELYVDGLRPNEGRHVFASVQSLDRVDLSRLDPEQFDVVIVDEFHHAAAPTYARLLKHLRPKELIGLTATPERADSEDVLHYFDGHISVELRLWDALERGLLCPFQYFGVNDGTDLSTVQWSRRGYDVTQLANVYTADDARVRIILQQIDEKIRDCHRMRALGFCVSIAHARFMADRFTRAGLPSIAVTQETDSDTRAAALRKLQDGEIRALFAVDVFNEGVDLPAVDTLLLLRPTESAVVFMQQLGRGLRRSTNKDCLTVLDFIGQSHKKFRFDLRYRAITGASRVEVEKQVDAGFPFLPAGCTMQLDRVAKEIVLENLRTALPSQRPAMVRECRELVRTRPGNVPTLAEFLDATRLELEDVYKAGCWSGLKRQAGIQLPPPGPDEDGIGDRLSSLLHVDDDLRLAAYRRALSATSAASVAAEDPRLLAGLHYTLLGGKGAASTLGASMANLHSHPAIVDEMRELLDLLEARESHLTYPLDDELGWKHHVSLSVHARHSTSDILTAFGLMQVGENTFTQKGVFRDDTTNSDLFLVTLEKSDRDYSPTTLYKDYAISSSLFHWQSQSTHTQRSKPGQRYIRHGDLDGHILLFVRQSKKKSGRTEPYTFLGPVDYVSHQGERPISFVWRLRRPMPADFFRQANVVAG